jgi:hypothetical protein
MKHFDPFDPNNRDRRKRRTKEQIQADEKAWIEGIDGAFKISLQENGWPDYIQSDFLLEYAAPHHQYYYSLRRNMKKSMARIGYTVLINPNSKDGRWKAFGKNVFVFRRNDVDELNAEQLKEKLEW